MKKTIFIILFFLVVKTSVGQTLYSKDGIRLSYQATFPQSTYCSAEEKQVYLIRYTFELANNSGRTARITISVGPPLHDALARAGCMSEDVVFQNSDLVHNGFEKVLSSGESQFVEVQKWYFSNSSGTPSWQIFVEFDKDAKKKALNN